MDVGKGSYHWTMEEEHTCTFAETEASYGMPECSPRMSEASYRMRGQAHECVCVLVAGSLVTLRGNESVDTRSRDNFDGAKKEHNEIANTAGKGRTEQCSKHA